MAIVSTEKLAITGGSPSRSKPWPQWPVWDETEERALLEVLRSGQWWSVGGAKVPEFEAAFAALHDAEYATCVTNGTAALEVALRALRIGHGDEVIVPPYTFVATASSVLAVGAIPIFADIDADSLNIDPARIEEAITPRTKAIIPVHIAGGPADLDGICAIAAQHGLKVIEDAAQAHLAEWNDTRVGAIGDLGTFSFQASKNLNCGEGGIVITNNEEWAERVWSVHNVGRPRSGRWYEHSILGGNFRMTEWQAAILIAQLARLGDQTERRTANAAVLTNLMRQIPGISVADVDPRITRHAYHLFMFRYNPHEFGGKSRDEFIDAVNSEGVPCGSGYVPLYREALFERIQAGDDSRIDYRSFADRCPVCEAACKETVWLFQTQLLGPESDMADIAGAVAKIRSAWV